MDRSRPRAVEFRLSLLETALRWSAMRLDALVVRAVANVAGFGRFVRFATRAFMWLVVGPGRFSRVHLLLPQLYYVGTLSIMVIVVLGTFVGAAIGVEAYSQFEAFGIQSRVGSLIALTVVAQVGPVLAATMIAGRVGGSISSELGSMQITEQIDALRVMGVDPISYLVVPRVVACLVMMPILTVFSDMLGIMGGYVVVVLGYHVSPGDYWRASAQAVTSWDVCTGLIKGVVFGWQVGMISCYKGFYCERGASGVGRAATESFVTTFMTIIFTDLALVEVFKRLYPMIFGVPHPTVFG